MKLLTAILSKLIGHLLSFAHTSVQFSLSPIMCILDALAQLNSSLTGVQSLDFNLSANTSGVSIDGKDALAKAKVIEDKDNETRRRDGSSNIFLGTEIKAKSIDVKNFNKVESLRNSIKSITPNQKDIDRIKETIENVSESINLALVDMESTILEIFNIGEAIQCESERSIRKASDSIESITQWIQLINLIRSIIRKKTRIIASGIVSNTEIANNALTNQDIADIIGDTLDKVVVLVESDADNVGILITENSRALDSQSPLSIYSCNIKDFIESTNLDRIIEDAKTFAENNTVGKGNDPKYVASDYIRVGNDNFLPFDLQNKDILLQLKNIFDFLNIKNPYDINDAKTQNTPSGKLNDLSSISEKIDAAFGNIGQIKI